MTGYTSIQAPKVSQPGVQFGMGFSVSLDILSGADARLRSRGSSFKTASIGAAVTNLVSMTGAMDIPSYLFRDLNAVANLRVACKISLGVYPV